VAGTPLERSDVTAYLQRDQQRIIPLVFLILLGITYRIYRVKRFALISLICVLLALLWTMGIVGFAGIALNVITSLLPPVIMVVSVAVAIHLLNQYIDAVVAGVHTVAAVEHALQQVSTACLLTSLTTALGFFSLLVSPVPAVQEFALFAGVGVLLAFLVTMTVVPLALLHLGRISPERLALHQQRHTARLLNWLPRGVSTHRDKVLVGALLILVLLLPGIGRLSEGTDIIRDLKKDAPLRISSEFIDQHLSGVNSLELMVQSSDARAMTHPAAIRQVLTFSAWLRTLPGVTAVYSPWELLRGIDPDMRAHDEQITVLATLLPLALPLEKWLNVNTNRLRLSARVVAMNSEQFLKLAQQVEQQAAQVQLPVQVTGSHYLLAQMSRTLVQTQIRSLLLAVALILGCITLFLRSWKLGLLAAVPNVLPPLMIFGLMGWCGIVLSTATTMIASVALGLIVDDTIHLLYRYRHEKKAGRKTQQAMAHAIRHTGRALIFTTLILILGFWAGMFGSFKPTISFAFWVGLTMVVALLADLLVLPATIMAWECGMRNTKCGMAE
jgi:predicted RND superfamily exporter protein